MRLYVKILLAFTLVIAIAVFSIAIAVGNIVETEFRSYNALYSNRAQRTSQELVDYYTTNASWDDVQDQLLDFTPGGRGAGPGQQHSEGVSDTIWSYRVADAEGRIIANFNGDVSGSLNKAEIRNALPLKIDSKIIGYLALNDDTPLEQPAEDFLRGVNSAVWFGVAIALITALLTAGLLARGITAPIRTLTHAADGISDGALDSRAAVSGTDEIAQLALTFNNMAANLQRAEQSREAQTADIAHELRNPLAILQGSLEALADGVYKPTPENIEPALDQVRTLNRLVEDLRTLALADAGRLRLDKQSFDLSQLLRRIVDAHRESFEGHNIALHSDLANKVIPVKADYDRLTQVINNIFGNIMRYVSAGGSVIIHTQVKDQGVTVSIIDDGPGVHQDDLPHLFERFWRGDPSRSRETGGSGLGLTIARRIIDAHAGRIWAEPTPGGGLTLKFWLPVI